MITGDHALTALSIAQEIGLVSGPGEVVVGTQIETMTDAELWDKIAVVNIYARVSPLHKLRIVRTLQRQGHVVAMTGDGINDAPALRESDIGINIMQRRPRPRDEGIFSRGFLIDLSTMLVFVIGLTLTRDLQIAQTMAFATLVMCQLSYWQPVSRHS